MCEALQKVKVSCISNQAWTITLPRLRDEESKLSAWDASTEELPRPRTPFRDAVEAAVEALAKVSSDGCGTLT